MKLFKRKISDKGFSHVEMLLLIVVVLAISGVGFYVYQNHSKNVSHAGSWTRVDTGTVCLNTSCSVTASYVGQVCKQLSGNTYYIKGMATDVSTSKVNGFFPVGSSAQMVDSGRWSSSTASIKSTQQVMYVPLHKLVDISNINLTVTAQDSFGSTLNRSSIVNISSVNLISKC